jgi:hypothetical protein
MAKPKPITEIEGKFEPINPHSDVGLETYKKVTDKRFADMEQLTKAILFVAIIALIGVVVAVAGLVIDQMHFNNSTYNKQYGDDQAEIRLLQSEVNELKAKP